MAKHVRIIPDCPKCGNELNGIYRNLPPFDGNHPFGSGIEGWWECDECGYKSDMLDHKPYDDIKQFVEKDE